MNEALAEGVSKIESAQEIYDYLREQKSRYGLEGFGKGIVKLPENRILNVILRASDGAADIFTQRGFSKEEIDSGVITLINFNLFNRQDRSYKNIVITDEGLKAMLQTADDEFVETEISDEEMEAIYVIAQLSAIPGRIFDQFRAFKEFLEQIDNPNLDGIGNTTDFSQTGILYDGGLDLYVDAIGRMRKGSWDTGTSFRRAVSMSAKDNSDYYEDITKRIDDIRKGQ